MSNYFAVVFCDLERHSLAWSRVPRSAMVSIIAEYRYLAQSIASQYGRRHENFAGDGHMFMFESADVAVHFSLKLIAFWKQRRRSLLAVHSSLELPLRIGCHFGECTQLADDAWIGRAINLAKQVEGAAAADLFFATQTVIDLIDLPFYVLEEAGLHPLKGDFLSQRHLYRVISVDQTAFAERPAEERTAEDWFLRAIARENTEEEAECYAQALALRPDYAEAHNNLAILLKRSGQREAAVQHYQQAIAVSPHYAEAYYNYAILLEEANDYDAASAKYREALQRHPDYIDALNRYANLLASRGAFAEAQRHYEEALRLRPGSAEAHNNYAILLERNQAFSPAREHYAEALRLRPDYAQAHYNYAIFLEGQNEPENAETHYRAALSALPDYAEAHNNLAVLLHSKGDLAAAETHYVAALRLRPSDPETNYNFALLTQAKGDAGTAAKYFQLARELAPDISEFRTAIGHPE